VQQDSETTSGWIEHDGAGRPVDVAALVDVRYRSGATFTLKAGYFDDCGDYLSQWVHDGQHAADIIAYRVAAA
jgi:hypothetical protein